MGDRIQKYLASAGVASRRAAEELVRAGRVRLNGRVVDRLGVTVEAGCDRVEVDGNVVVPASGHVYVVLNKPRGVLSTAVDPRGRRTVLDLVEVGRRVYPVGRLDYDSEGLLLLTDDGDLTMRLTHPRHSVEKEYRVLVGGGLGREQLVRLREGVPLDGRLTAPATVDITSSRGERVWLRIVLREGRNRQIRRMLEAVGGRVERLRRIRIGPIELGDLPIGKWRALTSEEVAALRVAAQ